jgi:hypothetical protein
MRADGGGWIRLVSGAEHGELNYAQRNLGDAGEPQNLDLIRIDVIRPRAARGQPENWLVGNQAWKLLQRPAPPSLQAQLVTRLQREGMIFGSPSDRLAAASFQRNAPANSLALIKPRNPRFIHEITGSKKRVRALFEFGEYSFNFSVTDPPFEQRIKSLPPGDYSPASLGISDENRLFFCTSLGEPFDDGNCYKLVAGVLVFPESWPRLE